uniref:Uncharacterized protein n=1 Tax=Sipha flava TaxID=143950 RepID=A0A2S2Q1A3_9HEMI
MSVRVYRRTKLRLSCRVRACNIIIIIAKIQFVNVISYVQSISPSLKHTDYCYDDIVQRYILSTHDLPTLIICKCSLGSVRTAYTIINEYIHGPPLRYTAAKS